MKNFFFKNKEKNKTWKILFKRKQKQKVEESRLKQEIKSLKLW